MRNYKSEYKWAQKKYDNLRIRINKELGLEFREKLKKDKKTINGWATEQVEKYLNQ